MDEMYSVASPYHGCTEDSDLLRAMIDSSEHVTDHTKMIGFDLERIKADLGEIGDPRFCDCEVRTQLAAAIAEIERLQNWKDIAENRGAIIRRQITIIRNRDTLAEEQAAEIERLRADLEQAEICIQARLDVIDQQAARIQELGGMLSIRTEELEIAHSCARSEREMHEKELVVFARKIAELEDALVEERARYDYVQTFVRAHKEIPSDLWKSWHALASDQLKAEGKIGSSDHSSDVTKKVWQITEERKAAIWHAVAVLKENDPDDEHLWDEEIAVLRAMLTEAE
jgi:hypothetical protein